MSLAFTRVVGTGVLFLALSSVACGKNQLIEERLRTQAPSGPKDTGLLLEGVKPSEVETLLKQNPKAQVRILNTEHGMYELFGVTRAEAEQQAKAFISENSYFQFAPSNERPLIGTLISGLQPCAAGTATKARLNALHPYSQLNGASITLGQAVQVIDATESTEVLRSSLTIKTPRSSSTPSHVIKNPSTFEFVPDALGAYELILAVQNKENVCSISSLRFTVTVNRPYNGPFTADQKFELKKMKHLAAVSAEKSWTLSEGEGVTIAVIDTGVNYNHPALADSIALNSDEIPDNQIDDDGNGFVDDVLGYDFVNSDSFPYDDVGHGSHVAGLAVGRPFGLARKAKLIPIKALSSLGGDMGSIAGAIRYAVDRGARIINLSVGEFVPSPHPALISAIDYAERKGVLVVAAAGNGDPATGLGMNIDKSPIFPASLRNENILSVGAYDSQSALSFYSNFGLESVDVVAPGGVAKQMILSATAENPHNNLLQPMMGTSMATPIVAGIAAQVWSRSPRLSIANLKEILISAGQPLMELKPICVSGRHIDAFHALQTSLQRPVTPSNVLF